MTGAQVANGDRYDQFLTGAEPMTTAERRGRIVLVAILVWVLVAETAKYAVFWSVGEPVASNELTGEVFKFVISLTVMVAVLRGGRSWLFAAFAIMLVRAWLFGRAAWDVFTWEPAVDGAVPRFGSGAGLVFAILSAGYFVAAVLLRTGSVSEYLNARNPLQPPSR